MLLQEFKAGRSIAPARIPAYVVTTTSMTIGATLMLASGLIFEELPVFSSSNWGTHDLAGRGQHCFCLYGLEQNPTDPDGG